MHKQPLVTVITATYNLINAGRQEMFKRNVDSVKMQSYPNIEQIVIDGASTDGTLELLEKYKERGEIIYYSEPDKGIYDAMNKGIKKANGKYVVCLNSDDCYIDKDAVKYLVEEAEKTNSDAVYAHANVVDCKTGKVVRKWTGVNFIIPGRMPNHQTFLIKTEVLKELGLYNLDYKVSADFAFISKMVNYDKKFSCIDRTIVNFCSGGFSQNNFFDCKLDNIVGYYLEYGRFHGLTPEDCCNLYGEAFKELPLKDMVDLGVKLEMPEWIKNYFDIIRSDKKDYKEKAEAKYYIFGLPVFEKSEKGKKVKLEMFGIPIWKKVKKY